MDTVRDLQMEVHMGSEPESISSGVESFSNFIGTGGDSCQRLFSTVSAIN